ncbi:Ser/Thr phosphatase family protein [Toxoplasma gondii p89]|uniref:Ser/Thr phosphatase family protein n=2 Tax=Toxoplasma gondii TaxID=5811 RepID=A0A2G8XSS7_TOXGO|nr:Ser/Thr phosphatase family protein [Toxoplasma gondii p89]PIL98085.1 Ser/Thr phosphatase family protein [Toxoplasma gondii COUG]
MFFPLQRGSWFSMELTSIGSLLSQWRPPWTEKREPPSRRSVAVPPFIESTWHNYLRVRVSASISLVVLTFLLTCFMVRPMTAVTSDPLDFHWPGSRILAVGDLHGDIGNTMLLLYGAGVVDEDGNWIAGDTLLIQTGDVVDRGPDGKRIYDYFASLSAQATEQGGKIIQLLGNHDVMNICGDFRYAHPSETIEFGGALERRRQFMDGGHYGNMLRSFPLSIKANGVIFSHAGIPSDFAVLGLSKLTQQLREELANDCKLHNSRFYNEAMGSSTGDLFVAGSQGPLWTRVYSMGQMTKICEELDKTLGILDSEKMVIGHTVQESGNIEVYCGGRLLLIDTGVSRYVADSPRMLEIRDGTFFEWRLDISKQGTDSEPNVRGSKRQLNIPPLKNSTDITTTNTDDGGSCGEENSNGSSRGDEL